MRAFPYRIALGCIAGALLVSCGGHNGTGSVLPPGMRQRLSAAQAALVQSQSMAGSLSATFGAAPAGATLNNDTPRSPVTIANGVAYVSDYQTSTAYAFDAATGAQLWSKTLSGKGIVGPIVVNGKLYVGNIGGAMTAWTP